MDRQLQPVHLKARVQELVEEEVLELEALLEQEKAAEARKERLEELRVKPGSRLEYEYLERVVQGWKKEKNIQPRKKPKNWKKFNLAAKIAATVCASAFGIYGITQGLIYAFTSTPEEIAADAAAEKQLNQLARAIDQNCNGNIEISEFAKAYEIASNKQISFKEDPRTSFNFLNDNSTSIKIE
ncbi:MAG: hypothetical protein AABW48_03580 [Nanoarchaeota archaeon]